MSFERYIYHSVSSLIGITGVCPVSTSSKENTTLWHFPSK